MRPCAAGRGEMSEYLNGEIGAIKDLLREIRDLLRDRLPEPLRCATCARPVDRDHKDACELADGKGWVCSEACWEEFSAKYDRMPEPNKTEEALSECQQREDEIIVALGSKGILSCDIPTEIARLRAGYDATGLSGAPCPGCVYENGRFVRLCGLHARAEKAEESVERLTRTNTDLRVVCAQMESAIQEHNAEIARLHEKCALAMEGAKVNAVECHRAQARYRAMRSDMADLRAQAHRDRYRVLPGEDTEGETWEAAYADRDASAMAAEEEIARLRKEVERLTRERDDARGKAWKTADAGARAEKAEAEVERLRGCGEENQWLDEKRAQFAAERDQALTRAGEAEAERDRLREERIGLRRWAEARDDGAALAGIRSILAAAPEPDEDGGDDE